ncbi:MAG: cytosine deaminase [Rikenellaceae bacterium]|nr:cytosine deaminase [Rikenellaceae bacterium]
MSSSPEFNRKTASNLLWTPEGLVRNPLVEWDAEGHVVSLRTCDAPDREPFTEFLAGLLVLDFPCDIRATLAHMQCNADIPLPVLLSRLCPAEERIPVVISGIDYETMQLTANTRITPVL